MGCCACLLQDLVPSDYNLVVGTTGVLSEHEMHSVLKVTNLFTIE